jgi:hypothetical protein
MAEESLKIVLTADNKQAIAAMKETILSLDGVEKAAGKTGGKVVKMGKDFTGVSRVIQDLPYGFNAIANNITNILPAAGGLGLAISAVTAAFQINAQGFENWANRFFGYRKELKQAITANEEYVKSLAAEKTQLDLLFRTATNANLPMRVRIDAVKELRNVYGDYLKGFSDEEILAGKAAKAYDNLSAAIVKKAKAQAASNLITKKQEEKLLLEQQIADAEALVASERAKIQGPTVLTGRGGATMGATASIRTVKEQQATLDARLIALTQDQKKAIIELDKEMARYSQTVDENTVKLKTNNDEKSKSVETKKPVLESIKEENAELERQIQAYKNLKFAMMGQGTIMPEREKGKDLTNLKLTLQGNTAYNDILQRNNDLEEQKLANMELANNLTNTAMNSLTGLANAMMNGQNIGQALGDMFKRLAIDIALAAAKAAIFQGILSILGPAKAGSGFFKGFGKLLGFSEGGTVSGPRSGYPVMLHGTEHIVRPDQMRSIIASASQMGGGNSRVVVEGVVRGNDIWLSQSRTNTFRALSA